MSAGTVQCIECARFRLKDAGPMAKFGFGLCALIQCSYEYRSSVYPRLCEKWLQAEPDVLAARRDWQQSQKRGEG